MPEPLYRHPSRSEIIELAVAEGHDADIPSNVGSLRQIPSNAPSHKVEKSSPAALDKDVEKGATEEASISTEEEVEDITRDDPNIVFWDGPNDSQNPMNWTAAKKWGTDIHVPDVCELHTDLSRRSFRYCCPCFRNHLFDAACFEHVRSRCARGHENVQLYG